MSSFPRRLSRLSFACGELLTLVALTASCLILPAGAQSSGGAPPPQQEPQKEAQANPPSPSSEPVEHQVGLLEPGKPVERELMGGEPDVYQVELQAGEFLHVVVQKKGIDVALLLLAADGSVLAVMYNPNGGWGPVPASLIARTAGSYTLKIRPLNRSAAPARYSVSLDPPRQPTASDQMRLAAEQAYVAGSRLAAPGTKESTKALEQFQTARKLWESLGDQYQIAMTLLRMAYLHRALVEESEALGDLNLALPLARAAGDPAAEATILNGIGLVHDDLGEKQEALASFTQALPLRRAVGDRTGEAAVLNNIGKVYSDLGKKQKALEYYNQALPLVRAVGDRIHEAIALSGIGEVYSELGEKQKALDYFTQALPLHRAVGNRDGEAVTLSNIGAVYSDLGDKQKALDYYNQALPLHRAVGNRAFEALTLSHIGEVYSAQGEQQKALEYYSQALLLQRAVGDRTGEAVTLSNIGQAHSALGEKQKALDYFNQALPLERAVGDPTREATTLGNIGEVYSELGEKQKALDYFTLALPLWRAVQDRGGEAVALNNVGNVYSELGEKQKALDYYTQALALWRAVGDPREAITLSNVGLVYSDLGDKQKALDYFSQALPLERAAGDRYGQAVTLNNIGLVYSELGEKQKALGYYTRALSLSRAVQDPLAEGNVLGLLMDHWKHEKNLALAIFFGKQAVNTYQQVRSNIRGLEKELQGSFLHSHSQVYRELADLLIDQGRLAEAIQVLDLLKDEEYFEYTGRRTRGSSGATTQLAMAPSEAAFWQDYQKIQDEITAAGEDAAALSAKKGLTPEEQQRLDEDNRKLDLADKALQKNYDALFAEWKQTGSQESAQRQLDDLRKTQLPELQALVGQLGAGTVGLYTVVAENEFHIIVVTSNAIVARQFPITAKDLSSKIAKAVQVLDADPASTSRPDPKIILKQLYDILIAPIEKDLAGADAQTLMWHLDGGLQYIPMAALYDGKQFLVERYSTAVFNSTAHLNEPPKVESWRGLGLGDCRPAPKLGLDDALLSVPGELRGIIRGPGAGPETGIMPGELMLDETFTREAMIHALRDRYPIIHIASHFVLSPGNEGESFILLGPAAQDANRRLTLDDIAKREFSFAGAELVTLSACQTAGGGSSQNGKEMDSLAEDIRQKGAKAVMASLWHVDDDSTGLLMADFYHRWIDLHVTKAEALRQAQLDLLYGRRAKTPPPADPAAAAEAKRCATASDQTLSPSDPNASFADPNYWAPFFLYGNWQ